MDAIGEVNDPLELLIAECSKTWPHELASTLTTPHNPEAKALRSLIEFAREGGPATLPYVHVSKGQVFWVGFGPDLKSLLEYGEDLRAWVVAAHGTNEDLKLLQAGARGRLSQLVDVVSPSGYLRWTSNLRDFRRLVAVLGRMHAFLKEIPAVSNTVAPSLHVLRFRFVTALRLGQWATATEVIDEIDRWSLEQAHKTMQMRLRVFGESGSHSQVLELVDRHRLWALPHPTRVAEVILNALVHEVVRPLELTGGPAQAFEGLKPWYTKLTALLPYVGLTGALSSLFAYVACLDRDAKSAATLLPALDPALADFVRTLIWPTAVEATSVTLPLEADTAEVETEATDGQSFWTTLKASVRFGAGAAVRRQLDELDGRILDDVDFLAQAPDSLLEMISDPSLDERPTTRIALQEVVTALVDAALGASGFPALKHLDLYLSLAEALAYLRGATANDEDAHLLHGLLAAIANLSPTAVRQSAQVLRDWWRRRPILSRLDWLIGVLDSLAPLHPEPDTLLDLWSDAVSLATRKKTVLTQAQLRTWERVARLLEIPTDSFQRDLAPLRPPAGEASSDSLEAIGWRKIAIVSLQEGSARGAALELEARTGASVTLVSGLVQDGLTKAAQQADIVLLVWAACSHAVYRAFDNIRERLVYVQGTGTSSILAAAERHAEQSLAKTSNAREIND